MSTVTQSRIKIVNHVNMLNRYGRHAGVLHLRNKGVPIEETLAAVRIHSKYRKG